MNDNYNLDDFFNKIKSLDIYTPQGFSGALSKESRFVFNYTDKVNSDAAVSLSMTIRTESYSAGDLWGVFSMNRPEGYLRYIIEDRLKRNGAPSDMLLLYLAGSNQIGRLTYALPGKSVPVTEGELLSDLISMPSVGLFNVLLDKYALGSGISGVQPKALVPIKREDDFYRNEHTSLPLKTVIVKTEGDDYPGLARNEYFCMSVAKAAGFDVPEFWLSDDGLLFIMSRFDRKEDGSAIGFEDMAVLTGRTTEQKYEGSYELIARAVEAYAGEQVVTQLKKLFERVALSCFLRDGDAHLKNFGVIYEHPNAQRLLAPVYDVVCTDVYPELDGTLALKLNKTKTFPTKDDLHAYGTRLGISTTDVDLVLNKIKDAYESVMTAFEDDPRYQVDNLLQDIKNSIERIEPKPKSPKYK